MSLKVLISFLLLFTAVSAIFVVEPNESTPRGFVQVTSDEIGTCYWRDSTGTNVISSVPCSTTMTYVGIPYVDFETSTVVRLFSPSNGTDVAVTLNNPDIHLVVPSQANTNSNSSEDAIVITSSDIFAAPLDTDAFREISAHASCKFSLNSTEAFSVKTEILAANIIKCSIPSVSSDGDYRIHVNPDSRYDDGWTSYDATQVFSFTYKPTDLKVMIGEDDMVVNAENPLYTNFKTMTTIYVARTDSEGEIIKQEGSLVRVSVMFDGESAQNVSVTGSTASTGEDGIAVFDSMKVVVNLGLNYTLKFESGGNLAATVFPLKAGNCTQIKGNSVQYFDECVCPDGYGQYNSSSTSDCAPCGIGKYRAISSSSPQCTSCHFYKTTTTLYGVTDADCECRPSFSTTSGGDCVCPKGYYFHAGNIECLPCGNNLYKDTESNEQCFSCGRNKVYNATVTPATSEGQCECRATFQMVDSSCVCQAGYYVDTSSDNCMPCSINTYKEEPGVSACTSCHRSMETTGVGHTSRYGCSCRENYYKIDPLAEECMACPNGAECSGGSAAPYAKEDYFPSPNILNVFLTCPISGVCGNNTACGDGYEQTMCSVCSENYYSVYLSCLECPGNGLFIGYCFFMFVVVLLLYVANYRPATYYEALRVLLNFMQIMALMASLRVQWPSIVRDTFRTFALFNFNLELFSPECMLDLDMYSKWELQAYMPIAAIAAFVFIFAVHRLHAVVVHALQQGGTLPKGADIKNPILSVLLSAPEPDERIWQVRAMLRGILIFLTVAYLGLACLVFRAQACFELEDGTVVMTWHPTEECYTDKHWDLVIKSIIFGLVYLVLFPAISLLLTVIKHKKNHGDPDWISVTPLGAMFIRYSRERYWWEVVQFGRRILIAAVFMFLADSVHTVVLTGGIVFLVSGIIHVVNLPYRYSLVNTLETTSLCVASTTMMLGNVFYAELDTAVLTTAMTFILLLCIFSVVILVIVVGYNVMLKKKHDSMRKRESNFTEMEAHQIADLGMDEDIDEAELETFEAKPGSTESMSMDSSMSMSDSGTMSSGV